MITHINLVRLNNITFFIMLILSVAAVFVSWKKQEKSIFGRLYFSCYKPMAFCTESLGFRL